MDIQDPQGRIVYEISAGIGIVAFFVALYIFINIISLFFQ